MKCSASAQVTHAHPDSQAGAFAIKPLSREWAACGILVGAIVACESRPPSVDRSNENGPEHETSATAEPTSTPTPAKKPRLTGRRIITGRHEPHFHDRVLPKLGTPDKDCIPTSQLGAVHALGPSIEGDCFYDLTPEELFDYRSCPYANYEGCPESFGPYYGRLVRLRHLELNVTAHEDMMLPVHPPRGPYHTGCGGNWRVGVLVGKHLLQLVSLPDEDGDSLCRPQCRNRSSNPRPSQPTRAPKLYDLYPACPSWVWDELTLVVRPKAVGLEVVVPPEGSKASDWL